MPASNVVITRANNALPRKARSDVKQGEVFALLTMEGAVGKKRFAHVGHNGKYYSVNLDNGAIAETTKGDREVALIGSFQFKADWFPYSKRVKANRADLKPYDVYRVSCGDNVYMHLNQRDSDNAFMSLNLGSGNVASTDNGRSCVTIIGRAKLDATIAN